MTRKRKEGKRNHQDEIYRLLGGNPIAYNSRLTMALGSPNAGIMIGQLLFWQGLGVYGDWIFKTADDMYHETGLTRRMQEKVVRDMKKLGILEVRLRGIPPKRNFKIDTLKLQSLVMFLQQSGKLPSLNEDTHVHLKGEYITESTAETTTDTNMEIKNKLDYIKQKHQIKSF
jgi:hypothetical protein